jgi:phage terminase large subunit-like protein
VLVDELHAHKNAELYLALRTSMLKRPGSKMVTISTAGVGAESPLGRLRTRALSLPAVTRSGALTRAVGPSFAMLEWAVPEDADVDDPAVVKRANPASWITEEGLAEQREAVHDLAFRRYHANQWTTTEHHWLPPGAWQACASDYVIEAGEAVWIGVDVGGSRSASAVVHVTDD